MKFSELQQLIKEKLGIDHLADIARELSVSPQAVSNWKARDRVPYKYVLKVRKQLEDSDTQVSGQTEKNAADSNQGFPQYFEENTISVIDILLILAKHLRIIIITPTIFCALTIIYVQFIAHPSYESLSKIISSSGGGSQTASLAAQLGFNLSTNQPEQQWVYSEVIQSRTLARAMLKRNLILMNLELKNRCCKY